MQRVAVSLGGSGLADVFISYARADEAVARRVAKSLESAGLDVWWDAELPAHRAYSEVIERNLADAKAVVVLWSKAAASSQWVRAEADFARNAGKLVQAQLDGTLPPMPFNQIQCAGLKGWRGSATHAGWAKLHGSVKALVSGEEAPIAPMPASYWDRLLEHRRWIAAGIVVLLAAAALFLFLRAPADDHKPVLAVLPFKSLDARDESLVAGIWEDTRQMLSRNPQLLVLGPNTSEELAENSKAARHAADYLVEASVRTAGDRVRVSANLVRTKDSAQLWSETFEQGLDDVFQLQSAIAREIEGRIRGRLAEGGGTKPEHIATSGEVYALYSDARAKIRNRQPSEYEDALKQLRKVVAADPNFAPGWATLSVAAYFGSNASANSEAYARRAIALAPNLAAGHAALGFALGNRGPVAQAALRRAVQLDPNDVEALNWLAATVVGENQADERLKIYSRIVEIEPLWWPAVLNKLGILLDRGDFAAAQRERERLQGLGSTLLAGMVGVAINSAKGDLSAAADIGIQTFRSVDSKERPIVGYELGFILLTLGYFDEVRANFYVPPPAPYMWRNDPKGLDMLEAEKITPRDFFTMEPLTQAASRVYVVNGRGRRLAEMYQSLTSSPAEFEAFAGQSLMIELAPLIAIGLREAGKADEASRLLAAAESTFTSMRRSPTPTEQAFLARIQAVQGRKPEAISLLVEAVQAGWVPSMPSFLNDIADDPALALLKGDARFEAARQRILGHIKKERAELGPVKLG